MATRDVQLRLTTSGVDEAIEEFDQLEAKIDEVIEKLDQLSTDRSEPSADLVGGDEIEAKLEAVQAKMDELSAKVASPDIDVRGADESLAKIAAVDVALDDLNAKSAALPSRIRAGGGGEGIINEFLAGRNGAFTPVTSGGGRLFGTAATGGLEDILNGPALPDVTGRAAELTAEDAEGIAQWAAARGAQNAIRGAALASDSIRSGGGLWNGWGSFFSGGGGGGVGLLTSLTGGGGAAAGAAELGEEPEGSIFGLLGNIPNGLLLAGAALPALGIAATGLTEGVTGVAAAGQGLGAFGLLALPTLRKVYDAITATGTTKTADLKALSPAERGIYTGVNDIRQSYDRAATAFAPNVVGVLSPLTREGGILAQILQDLVPFADKATPAIEKVEEQFNKFLDSKGAQQFQDAMQKLEGPEIVALADGLGRIATTIGTVWEKFAEGHDIAKDTTNFFDAIADILKVAGNWMLAFANGWDHLSHAIATFSTRSQTDLHNWAQDIDNNVGRQVKVLEDFGKFFVYYVYTEPHQTLDRAVGDVERWANQIGQGVLGAVIWFEQLPGRVMSALGNWYSELHTLGSHVVDGLLQGIESMAGSVISEAEHIADSVVHALSSALGIRSPSTVTREMGQNIGLGLAMGIDDSAAQVLASAHNLASKIPGALSTAGAHGSSAPLQISLSSGSTSGIERELFQMMSRQIRVNGGNPRILLSKG